MRTPILLIKEMGRDLYASRELARRLFIRDISSQYRQSMLGLVWAILPPIATALGLIIARNAGAININKTEIPYPAYVMFSTALWQTFVEALSGPITAVGQAKSMLSRINFPREALVLAKICEVLFNYAIKLILILGLFAWYQIPVTWLSTISLLAIIPLIVFGTGIGLILAPLSTLYGDISKLLPLILLPWMLITPVIYPVPQKTGFIETLVSINPVTPLLVTVRELATGSVLSHLTGYLTYSIFGLVFLIIGWILYRLTMPFIIERMGA